MVEAVEQLLDRLSDPLLRQTVMSNPEGYTYAEISFQIGKAVPTIERKIAATANCISMRRIDNAFTVRFSSDSSRSIARSQSPI